MRKGANAESVNVHQKPLMLVEYFIGRYCHNADWVLELCAGSGSFTAAALRGGKNVVSLDIDPRQVREAQTRMVECLMEDRDLEVGIKPAAEEAEEAEEAEA